MERCLRILIAFISLVILAWPSAAAYEDRTPTLSWIINAGPVLRNISNSTDPVLKAYRLVEDYLAGRLDYGDVMSEFEDLEFRMQLFREDIDWALEMLQERPPSDGTELAQYIAKIPALAPLMHTIQSYNEAALSDLKAAVSGEASKYVTSLENSLKAQALAYDVRASLFDIEILMVTPKDNPFRARSQVLKNADIAYAGFERIWMRALMEEDGRVVEYEAETINEALGRLADAISEGRKNQDAWTADIEAQNYDFLENFRVESMLEKLAPLTPFWDGADEVLSLIRSYRAVLPADAPAMAEAIIDVRQQVDKLYELSNATYRTY